MKTVEGHCQRGGCAHSPETATAQGEGAWQREPSQFCSLVILQENQAALTLEVDSSDSLRLIAVGTRQRGFPMESAKHLSQPAGDGTVGVGRVLSRPCSGSLR